VIKIKKLFCYSAVISLIAILGAFSLLAYEDTKLGPKSDDVI